MRRAMLMGVSVPAVSLLLLSLQSCRGRSSSMIVAKTIIERSNTWLNEHKKEGLSTCPLSADGKLSEI